MKKSDFKIIDFDSYGDCSKLTLISVVKYGKNEWRCITEDEFYLNVWYKGQIIAIGYDEREMNAMHEIRYIASSKNNFFDRIQVGFSEIAELMKWKYKEEDKWEGGTF